MINHIILQPAGKQAGHDNYSDTVENPVSISIIEKHINDNKLINELKEHHNNNLIPTWGVVPGNKDRNVKYWNQIQKGDVVLFARENTIISSAIVTHKLKNKELAVELWGYNENQESYEYLYFLDEVKKENIPYKEFNDAVGYAPNYIIRAFTVLDDYKSDQVIEYFRLRSDTYIPEVSEEDAFKELDPNVELDRASKGTSRTEQSFHRNNLFRGRKYSKCCICNNDFPIKFLVAAHIKQRARCLNDEKRDTNIVAPMCKFGCDELYERGYITIKDGYVKISKTENLSDYVNKYLETIEDSQCSFWNENTEKYFEWHMTHKFISS